MGEVVSPEDQNIVGPVGVELIFKVSYKVIGKAFHLRFTFLERSLHIDFLGQRKPLSIWIVMVEQSVSEDLRALPTIVASRATGLKLRCPNELHVFASLSLLLFVAVDSCEEHGFHAHFGEQLSIGCGVPKRIQLPAYFGNDPKLLLQEVMRYLEVSQDVRVVSRCFIGGHEPAMDNLKLARRDKLFYLGPVAVVIKASIPPAEECNVTHRVCVLLVFLELSEHRVKYLVHLSVVVLVVGLQPAGIHVRVGNKVNRDLVACSQGLLATQV